LIVSGLLTALLLGAASLAAQSPPADPGKTVATGRDVVLTLKIEDKKSGLLLEAKKSVPRGSNALQVLQDTVLVKYKTYPDVGAFVTGLCGVDAPEGMVWTFELDGKWSTVGIGNLMLEQDTVIEWATR
jgi:hypothetical protein